ncbi:MAG: iron ABC transporter permease, partial [Hoeflea sp. BRH_c9]
MNVPASPTSGRTRHPGGTDRGRGLWLLCLIATVAVLCMLSLVIGTRDVGLGEILGAIEGKVETIGEAAVAMRIPRTMLAVLAGAALGLAGAIMQGVTRNPLADPGILGVNMGASLAVAVGVAWFSMSSAYSYIWTAIGGAGLAAVFVYAIGTLGRGKATPLKLALAGAATSVAFSSLVIAVVLPRNDIAGGLRAWQIGGVGG